MINKKSFMDELSYLLKDLAAADRDEIIYDYEEHFRIGIDEGKTEEEIIDALGDPQSIAKQFNVEDLVKRAEEDTSAGNTLRALLAALGLGFFNLVFILGPFLALAGVLFGLFAAAGAITISGIAILAASVGEVILPVSFSINSTLGFFVSPAATFFAGIGLLCLGLLFIIADVYLTKFFLIGTVRYLKFNLKIIKGV